MRTAGFRGKSVVFQVFAPNDIFLSKKRHLVLDTVEQDVITPLASGAQPTAPRFLKKEPPPQGKDARIAQLVEQRIENPRVGGSNPPPGTIYLVSKTTSFDASRSRTSDDSHGAYRSVFSLGAGSRTSRRRSVHSRAELAESEWGAGCSIFGGVLSIHVGRTCPCGWDQTVFGWLAKFRVSLK